MSEWGGNRSAMEQPAQPQVSAEHQMAAMRLELEFGQAHPAWAEHPGLHAAAAKVAKAAQEAGEGDLGLFDERVGHLNRSAFYNSIAREMESAHSLCGDLRRLQGRK